MYIWKVYMSQHALIKGAQTHTFSQSESILTTTAVRTESHLGAVSGHCGCDVGSPVFLQQVYVTLCTITSPDMKQTEQLVHVVVDPELIHDSVG